LSSLKPIALILQSSFFIFLLCGALVSGCAHLGERVERLPLPEGAPSERDILADLAANDSAIANFKATGAFTLESPDLTAVKRFKDGSITFRRPADLCVVGRKYLGAAVFRLTCVGNEFLIEFPATREEPYYRLEGERFDSVPFSVSPSDIAREMFLPEPWAQLKMREVHVTSYEPDTQTATLEIGPKRSPRRRLVVSGPPWVVLRGERLGPDGETLAVTTKEDYRVVDGIRIPARIDAWFPGEKTRMTFDMRAITPNVALDNSLFDIRARAREVGLDLDKVPGNAVRHAP